MTAPVQSPADRITAIAFAAGQDAGNRSARTAGRDVWAAADYAAACAAYDRVAYALGLDMARRAERQEVAR